MGYLTDIPQKDIIIVRRMSHLYHLGIPVPEPYSIVLKLYDQYFDIKRKSVKTYRNMKSKRTDFFNKKNVHLFFIEQRTDVEGGEIYLSDMSKNLLNFSNGLIQVNQIFIAYLLFELHLRWLGFDDKNIFLL